MTLTEAVSQFRQVDATERLRAYVFYGLLGKHGRKMAKPDRLAMADRIDARLDSAHGSGTLSTMDYESLRDLVNRERRGIEKPPHRKGLVALLKRVLGL